MPAEPRPLRPGDERNSNNRSIVTPEGIAIAVEVADHGARFAAFLLDLVICGGAALVLLALLIELALDGLVGPGLLTVALFVGFLIRTAYFLHFELAWRGRTPGKRICGLRVIDRAGGRLTPAAIVARNLTREVEIFLPLGLGLTLLGHGLDLEQGVAVLVWIGGLAALPLFNRDHLRGGDLIAGTLVIALERESLPSELAGAGQAYSFSATQLALYGTYELQVLETLLRQPVSADTERALGEVCSAIRQKIGWPDLVPAAQTRLFLQAFYTAERDTLENRKIMGRETADKYAAAAIVSGTPRSGQRHPPPPP